MCSNLNSHEFLDISMGVHKPRGCVTLRQLIEDRVIWSHKVFMTTEGSVWAKLSPESSAHVHVISRPWTLERKSETNLPLWNKHLVKQSVYLRRKLWKYTGASVMKRQLQRQMTIRWTQLTVRVCFQTGLTVSFRFCIFQSNMHQLTEWFNVAKGTVRKIMTTDKVPRWRRAGL